MEMIDKVVIEGAEFWVVETRLGECGGCWFNDTGTPCPKVACSSGSSKWGKSVKFIKIEPTTEPQPSKSVEQPQSDGKTASYYELPEGAKELQDIIAFLNCNSQMGEIGRAWMRYGRCPHSPKRRDLNKIIFYAQAELERLDKYEPEQ